MGRRLVPWGNVHAGRICHRIVIRYESEKQSLQEETHAMILSTEQSYVVRVAV